MNNATHNLYKKPTLMGFPTPKKHIKSTEIRSILCFFVEEIFSSFGAFNRKNATIMT